MNRITGTAQKKSLLGSIWESFKEEWSRSNYWAKFTFIFRAAWALVVLGMQRSITLLVTVILVIGTMIGVAWWLVSGGYNVVLGVVLSPIMYVWAIAIMCYAYLLYKYPGKYATIGNRVTGAGWIRALPLWAAGVITLLFKLYEKFQSTLVDWKIPVHPGVLLVIAVISVLLFNDKAREKLSIIGKHPAFFIPIAGIAAINWLVWVLNSPFWESVWNDQAKFWAINLAFLGAVSLVFVIDENKKTRPIALVFSKIIGAFAVVILGICIVNFMTGGKGWSLWASNEPSDLVSRTGVENKSHSAPMEIALAVIADCESGDGTPGSGKQFYPDGRLVWNLEGSTAVGKYQILASMHEERAKKMGFDIRTEEGNQGYARVLYSESKTKHWEADPRSAKCWEPRLRAYTWGGGEAVSIVVVAPTDKWSGPDPIPTPYAPRRWEIEGFGKKYTVLWILNGRTEEEDFPQEKRVEKDPGGDDKKIIYGFKVKSRETSPLGLVVKFF